MVEECKFEVVGYVFSGREVFSLDGSVVTKLLRILRVSDIPPSTKYGGVIDGEEA
jgi:hypothetical protein